MIQIRNLQKHFGKQHVLRGVNLSIPKGKITVIIGPSGCGKSVLLRHMIGLLQPEQGDVVVDKVKLSSLNRAELNDFRKRFCMLFQHAALFDSLSVFENIAFPLIEHGHEKDFHFIKARVRETLALVGLADCEHKMPSELSGGMAKRVGLARAIALKPQIILYDEPTTGLDAIMTENIDNLILSMQRSLQITSVVISHDIPSTLRIADQIAMIHQGKIIACASPEEFQRLPDPVVQQFLSIVFQKRGPQ